MFISICTFEGLKFLWIYRGYQKIGQIIYIMKMYEILKFLFSDLRIYRDNLLPITNNPKLFQSYRS